MSDQKNMELWNKVCQTDPKDTKKMPYKGNLTAICAQSQIKKATEIWGVIGGKWGIKDATFNFVGVNPIAYYTATLYYPDGEQPINSDIEIVFRDGSRKGKYNEDWSKKLATDALTKGLSRVGFNADVFEGKFDDNKYVEKMLEKNKPVDLEKSLNELDNAIKRPI